jgi:hypothetical protein
MAVQRRRLLRALAMTSFPLLLTMLTSCSGGTGGPQIRSDGPLRAGGAPGALCLPRSGAQPEVTFGLEVITNEGRRPVRLQSVRLVEARSLQLVSAFVVPVEGHELVGSWSRWPPPRSVTSGSGVEWSMRRRLHGFEVAARRRRPLNLVLRARVTGTDRARFSRVAVRYDVGGVAYEALTSTAVQVRRRC